MEKENQPFLLLPPSGFIETWAETSSENKHLDNYLDIMFNDLKEEGGKSSLFSFLTQTRNYSKCRKPEYAKNLFGNVFCSMECLRNRLKNGGLEKTAKAIEMQQPNSKGVGKIIYKALNNNVGELGVYILK